MTKKVVVLCLFLFFASFFIRAAHGMRFVTFGQDQARDAFLMSQNQEEGRWVVGYGPKASVGNFYLPPLYYQIHNIASFLSGQHPLVMQWLIIFVESWTPVLVFVWLGMIVKRQAAFAGSLVYLVSAGVIEYATFAWNPNMIPFFSTLMGFCWFLVVFRNKKIAIPMGVVSLAVAVSLHFQAVVLVPFAFLVFIISLKKEIRNLGYWIVGALIASAFFIPYVLAELGSNWHNTQTMLGFFHENNTRYFDRISKPAFIFTFFPSLIERFMLLRNFHLYMVGRLLFFVGFLVLSVGGIRQRSKEKLLILIYFLSIFIMLRVYKGDKVDYYMSTLYILPAFLFAFLSETVKRFALPVLVVIAYVSGSSVFNRQPQNGLHAIQRASVYVKETVSDHPVRLLFQNQDFVNLFAFGLQHQGIKIDQHSEYVVDICGVRDVCTWNGKFTCEYSAAHTKSVIEKTASNYQRINEIEYAGAFRITIGKEEVSSVRQKFPFYQSIGSAGTDTLLPQLYSQETQ